ncbi:MAG TPA: hypothetical protein VEL79_13570 [Vicinamibacterales bacterium]|nr:hypothetical protein [Vicinamibacterales bacterium]
MIIKHSETVGRLRRLSERNANKDGKHRMHQILLDLFFRRSDSPISGVGSRSTPLPDIDESVH